MADSVDRVFSHALNTVNKIRTGSQKPPSSTRLRLYGLYKQAMEGDVDGIMDRPSGSSEQDQRAREKWDAWKQQNNLSRTEAKRRYITTLIDTMHTYASPSPDSRELVAELEFVWDQVKSNVPSSSSSSPLQTLDQVGTGMSASYSALERQRTTRDEYSPADHDDDDVEDEDEDEEPLQIKSPMSASEEDLQAADAELEDEFVDAPDSQYALALYRQGAMDHDLSHVEPAAPSTPKPRTQQSRRTLEPPTTITPTPRDARTPQRLRTIIPQPIPLPSSLFPKTNPTDKEREKESKHRHAMESSLIKLTAEVAALREQLEARRLFTHRAHYRFARGVWRFFWAGVKHFAIDVLVLALVVLWLRRKGDRRLEGAVRVLLGDAVARFEGVKVGLPGLPRLGIPRLGRREDG